MLDLTRPDDAHIDERLRTELITAWNKSGEELTYRVVQREPD